MREQKIYYPKEKTNDNFRLYFGKCQNTGGKIALQDRERKFSFEELNVLVNFFASKILEIFGSHGRVLLKLEHNAYMPIIIFACLKSHNTYVSIDNNGSIDDLKRISQTVGSRFLISQDRIEDFECLDLIAILHDSKKSTTVLFTTLLLFLASSHDKLHFGVISVKLLQMNLYISFGRFYGNFSAPKL